jgi:hypothetical protein
MQSNGDIRGDSDILMLGLNQMPSTADWQSNWRAQAEPD